MLVMFDLSAAFYTVDHDLLLSWLFDIVDMQDTALAWCTSFLSDRSSSVRIGASESRSRRLYYRVSQHSPLSPIMFNIYIIPLLRIIQASNIQFNSYDDATHLYLRVISPNPNLSRLITCMDSICTWMRGSRLHPRPK